MPPESATTDAQTIRVTVRLFSVLREKIGRRTLEMALGAPATAADLLKRLAKEHPAVGAYGSALRLAVNAAYAPPSTPLADGDEVALITPVSGG